MMKEKPSRETKRSTCNACLSCVAFSCVLSSETTVSGKQVAWRLTMRSDRLHNSILHLLYYGIDGSYHILNWPCFPINTIKGVIKEGEAVNYHYFSFQSKDERRGKRESNKIINELSCWFCFTRVMSCSFFLFSFTICHDDDSHVFFSIRSGVCFPLSNQNSLFSILKLKLWSKNCDAKTYATSFLSRQLHWRVQTWFIYTFKHWHVSTFFKMIIFR